MLIVRIVALVVGYCFGLIQTGYIFGKFNKIDIRDYGSGNSGATNALRVMGKKAGLIVLLGDFFKAFIPCLAFRLIFRNSEQINNILLLLYCGLGVVLGHSFPAHLGFRGGKGVASTAGIIASLDYRVIIACLSVFLITLVLTKYVSLSSILVMVTFIGSIHILSTMGIFGNMNLIELRVVSAIIGCLSIFRHKSNISRLLKGTENKISSKKSK